MTENQPAKMFNPDQKFFVVLCKEKGMKTPQIQAEFAKKWPAIKPPNRTTIYRHQQALHRNKNLSDQRKGKSGRRVTVRNQENIEAVRSLLESEQSRKPDQAGSTCRRNILNISKSSFHRIVKKDLCWKPYRIIRRQKITQANAQMRLKMGRYLARKPKRYFENLIVSDEAWFTLGGHVMNRQNNVLYAPSGHGAPDQWFTEAEQSHDKVMVFCLLHGSGEKFGPFVFAKHKTVDSHSYK